MLFSWNRRFNNYQIWVWYKSVRQYYCCIIGTGKLNKIQRIKWFFRVHHKIQSHALLYIFNLILHQYFIKNGKEEIPSPKENDRMGSNFLQRNIRIEVLVDAMKSITDHGEMYLQSIIDVFITSLLLLKRSLVVSVDERHFYLKSVFQP